VLEEEAQDDPPEPGEAAPGPGQRELQVERRRTAPSPRDGEPAQAGPRATTADLLEAVHEATGRDVIGDYFTRLYRPEQLTTLGTTLFAGLNKVSGEARLNWRASEGWITFRTASFFNDRLKEIPARHLDRWAKARKESGWLTPEALAEIASLADSQIESRHISDGAVAVHGLKEWRLVQGTLLPAWRLLATLPKSSRSVVTAEGGLRLGGVGGEAWKRFLELCFGSRGMDRGIGLLPADCSLLLVYETREGKRPLAEFRMSALLPDGELWETKVAPGSMSRGSRRM
jgi:hypothetical protein